MSATAAVSATWFERHGWKVLFGISALFGLFGIGDMLGGGANFQSGEAVLMQSVTGTSWNELQAASPRVATLIDMLCRTAGSSLVMFAALAGIICLCAFRRGERWAWYAMWALPLWMALTAFFVGTVPRDASVGTPAPVISGSILVVIASATLALSARPYFAARSDG